MTYQIIKWSDGSMNQHWSSLLPLGRESKDQGDSFLSYLVSCGLFQYLARKLNDGFCTIRKPKRPLLEYAIDPQPRFMGYDGVLKIVERLFREGTNPNEQYDGKTPWQRFLQTYALYNAGNSTDVYAEKLSWIHQQFLEYDADPNEEQNA
ncbi:hypothetical protein EJ04DRAFT_360291 [Polyplosphaeria fusca]|uniref:Uncharacterized protein n=1 Tax=Polyplosphaeria fusca TaxID=682080 RepID=A0A9P4V161_9PLEO|nr:hypothetical protein EJ04DRAFT_360291 [Polyplosphaeria fusca]